RAVTMTGSRRHQHRRATWPREKRRYAAVTSRWRASVSSSGSRLAAATQPASCDASARRGAPRVQRGDRAWRVGCVADTSRWYSQLACKEATAHEPPAYDDCAPDALASRQRIDADKPLVQIIRGATPSCRGSRLLLAESAR